MAVMIPHPRCWEAAMRSWKCNLVLQREDHMMEGCNDRRLAVRLSQAPAAFSTRGLSPSPSPARLMIQCPPTWDRDACALWNLIHQLSLAYQRTANHQLQPTGRHRSTDGFITFHHEASSPCLGRPNRIAR
ncbi:hypothetical protein BGZ61DRAFT_91677 [Ilyonectria robusta]|uniref:uncharacterized protein n=1 Tax=Ilyonectria robusta TaxID=1079257 RepID=UPI001E8D1BCD|nr:uncharacterized protein BGZ61DRAFT_91677 [Ilyonectria robusta]KAH8736168.1 hypothetical protein BGZ61DRAFT_91677 [Ilyonectria robusta]